MHCALCGDASDRRCTGCLSVAYCSVAHQREDWARHKGECKRLRAAAEAAPETFPRGDVEHEARGGSRTAVSARALFDIDVDVPAISSVQHTDGHNCMSCGEAPPTFIVSGQPLAAEQDASHLIWALFCDACADAQKLRYYYPRGEREYFVSQATEDSKFQAAHEGVTACPACQASGRDLVVVYDEVCDEFLVCNQCRKMRQQLRVWNKFQDVMLDDLKHPVVLSKEYLEREIKRQELFAENRRRVLNGEEVLSLPQWAV